MLKLAGEKVQHTSGLLGHVTGEGVLTGVHHSVQLHRHADAARAASGEVQGGVLSAFCSEEHTQHLSSDHSAHTTANTS